MLQRMKLMCALLAIASLTLGCAVSLESRSDACVWIKTIILDEGFETRLTRNEKEQILVHDENVERNCR